MSTEQVVCPSCGGLAHVNSSSPPKSGQILNVSACPHCGKQIFATFYPDGSRKVAATNCYVLTAIYGSRSRQVIRAMAVCRRRFALNPLLAPSWVLYKVVGPSLARASRTSPICLFCIDYLIAKPIIQASARDLSLAVLPLCYLAVWGWVVVAAIAYAMVSQSVW